MSEISKHSIPIDAELDAMLKFIASIGGAEVENVRDLEVILDKDGKSTGCIWKMTVKAPSIQSP